MTEAGLVLAWVVVVGLSVGSFLNVVHHRWPLMRAQRRSEQPGPVITLSTPASRCPHCGHQIRWFENIPVLSWLVLRGRCSSCKAPISWRYPALELAMGMAFGVIHLVGWPLAAQAAAAMGLSVLVAWVGSRRPA